MPSALIVDDHEGFRISARALLEAEGFTVAEASTADTAVRTAHRLKPDLVLLDVQLGDEDGVQAEARLASLEHPPVVILVSSREATDYGHLIRESRARGFITKSELSVEAIRSLR